MVHHQYNAADYPQFYYNSHACHLFAELHVNLKAKLHNRYCVTDYLQLSLQCCHICQMIVTLHEDLNSKAT